MDKLKNILSSIKEGLAKFSKAQKISIALIAGTIIIALVMLVVLSSVAEYTPLVSNLSLEEQLECQRTLQTNGIEYKIAGTMIKVKKSDHTKASAVLASQSVGVPFSKLDLVPEEESSGFGDFETITEKQAKVKRKLEYKLSQVLGYFTNIKYANVTLDVPEDQLYLVPQEAGTASVSVATKDGSELTKANVLAIKNLVAGASRKIKPSDVVVIDMNLNKVYEVEIDTDSAIASTHFDFTKKYQDFLETKLMELLNKTMGPSNAAVTVYLEFDFDKVSTKKTEYAPNDEAVTVHSTEKKESSERDSTGGAPGNRSNTAMTIETGSGISETISKKEEELEKVIASTNTLTEKNSPYIKKKTATVILNSTVLAERAQNDNVAVTQMLTDYSNLVATAIGSDAENVKVSAMPFYVKKAPSDETTVTAMAGAGKFFTDHIAEIILAVVALIALFILLGIIRKAFPNGQFQQPAAASPSSMDDEDLLLTGGKPDAAEARAQKIEQKVNEMADKDPDMTAGLIKRWITKEQ